MRALAREFENAVTLGSADLVGGAALSPRRTDAIGALRKSMASSIPRLYAILDGAAAEYSDDIIAELAGQPWLWMGTVFVKSDQVLK